MYPQNYTQKKFNDFIDLTELSTVSTALLLLLYIYINKRLERMGETLHAVYSF